MEKKTENNKKEQLYAISCSVDTKQKLDGVAVKFSLDDKEMWVPLNKIVNVPAWVYRLYLDSEWNKDKETENMDANHIRQD